MAGYGQDNFFNGMRCCIDHSQASLRRPKFPLSEAAGFISVWCVCGEAEINNIGVLEKFRRMGIAKALFDSAYNAAKAEKWYLEVRESNLGAISFYEKQGFERVGMRKNFYTAPTENAVLMALQPTENGEINDI